MHSKHVLSLQISFDRPGELVKSISEKTFVTANQFIFLRIPGEGEDATVHLEGACAASIGGPRHDLDDPHALRAGDWSEDDGGDDGTLGGPAPNIWDWLGDGTGAHEDSASDQRVPLVLEP